MNQTHPNQELLLAAHHLTKRFGGLAAVNEVSVNLYRDRIHAVIGPNGAGKSTLTNLLSGDLAPTSGTITLNGQPTAGHSPESISRLGLGRSYQKTNIFSTFTVWDNVRLSAQSRTQPSPFNPVAWFRAAAALQDVNQRAERAIELAEHMAQLVQATVRQLAAALPPESLRPEEGDTP
jgi:branched-chain amino acid transport system ATP-binding protein